MIKKFLKKILPTSIVKLMREYIVTLNEKKFSKMTTKEVFSEIYTKKIWSPEKEKSLLNFTQE